MMELASKKNVKVISLIIAAIFMFSFFIIGFDQGSLSQIGNSGSDPLNSAIGTVNYDELMKNAPGILEAQNTMRQAVDDSKKDFDEKSKTMNDTEKQRYYQQLQERLSNKEKELMDPVLKKIETTIKKVADKKGLSVVVDKNTVVYGGLDITDEVSKALQSGK